MSGMEGFKTCTGCGEVLPAEAFAWKQKASGVRQTRCRGCVSSYNSRWYAKNSATHQARGKLARQRRYAINAAVIAEAKAVPCVDCGGRFELEQMDFDHVTGTKRFNIGQARQQVSVETLRAEIAKCDVVCAACHRVRTARRAR